MTKDNNGYWNGLEYVFYGERGPDVFSEYAPAVRVLWVDGNKVVPKTTHIGFIACSYCFSRNEYHRPTCVRCGAPMGESELGR